MGERHPKKAPFDVLGHPSMVSGHAAPHKSLKGHLGHPLKPARASPACGPNKRSKLSPGRQILLVLRGIYMGAMPAVRHCRPLRRQRGGFPRCPLAPGPSKTDFSLWRTYRPRRSRAHLGEKSVFGVLARKLIGEQLPDPLDFSDRPDLREGLPGVLQGAEALVSGSEHLAQQEVGEGRLPTGPQSGKTIRRAA
jgi:hypothetical protein